MIVDEDKVQRENSQKMPKQTFATPSAAQLAAWQKKREPTIAGRLD